MWLRNYVGLLFLVVALLFPLTTSATFIEVNEEESIIVALKLKRFILSDALVAYHSVDYTLLSLEEFVTALDYPIDVYSEEGTAHGWFVNESNTFSLDIKKKEVYIRGKRFELGENFRYSSDDWGLYIDIQVLASWFGMSMTLLMDRLQIEIQSDIVQPIEKKAQRLKRQTKKKSKSSKDYNYPTLADKYHLFGTPGFDAQLTLDHGSERNNISYSIQGVGDLAYHEMRLSHNRTNQNLPANTRLTFYRDALTQGEDIALGVTNYQLGDIYNRGDSLVTKSSSGVGFELERAVDGSIDDSFSQRDFEGDAPPGWEIELYHNELLIDFQTVGNEGRYIFEDVPLQFGENIFEIRQYGPQGQERVFTERIAIGSQLIKPGDWQFSSSFIEEEKLLIGEPPFPPSSLSSKHHIFNASAYYGLFDQHSVGFGINKVERLNGEEERDYARLMWISTYGGLSTRIDTAHDILQGGQATNVEISGFALNQNFGLTHKRFSNFESIQNNWGNITQESELNIFGNIRATSARALPYSFNFAQSRTQSGLEIFRVENRLSYSSRAFRISNQLSSSMDSETRDPLTRGILSLTMGALNKQTRASVNYDVDLQEVTSISLAKTMLNKDWRFQLQGVKNFEADALSTLSFNASRLWGDFSLSFTAQASNDDTYSVGLFLEFGAYTHATRPYIATTPPGSVSSGSVKVKVFMDNDTNGIYSQDDDVLEGVKFNGRLSWENLQTDNNGELVLGDIDPGRGTVVHLDTLTLGDPFIKPLKTSVRVMSHAGGKQELLFPVNETSEVEGYIKVNMNGKLTGVGGITIGLFHNGEMVRKAVTEFDGYYLISGVIPGKYWVNVMDEDNVMTSYQWQSSAEFFTDMASGVAVVEDIVLSKRGE